MKQPCNSNIIICSIVRNAERGLRRNIPIMNEFCKEFQDYRCYVYENDSTDATKELLMQWQDSNKEKVFVCTNDTDHSKTIPSAKSVKGINPFFSHKRIDKMSHLRNQYMKFAHSLEERGFRADYLMVIDLDIARIDVASLMTSFAKGIEWDAVTAFGYSLSPQLRRRYHDTYALTLWGDEKNPQTEKKIKEYTIRFAQLKPNDEWIRVASAFGGAAIYRYEAVKGVYYTEPAIDNDDIRVEVKCEHFSLYKQIMERGYDRFYINPDMRLKYQDLTWKIIWGSLKRMIRLD